MSDGPEDKQLAYVTYELDKVRREFANIKAELANIKAELRGLLNESWPVNCEEKSHPEMCARLCTAWRKKLRGLL